MHIPPLSGFAQPMLQILDGARSAIRLIPPAFPLNATVAVNPYLGHAAEPLATASARLARAGGVRLTPPRADFRAALASGRIERADLEAALAATREPVSGAPAADDLARYNLSADDLVAAVSRDCPDPVALPTVADLAARVSGVDWPQIVQDRIGAWAAGYFDRGQALWPAPRGRNAYDAWRGFARYDLTPEIAGLRGFCTTVADAPDTAVQAMLQAADQLKLVPQGAESACHRWLMDLGGWAQLARWQLWQAELAGRSDDSPTDLLAVRMLWDAALLAQYGTRIGADWEACLAVHATPAVASHEQRIDAVLQHAAELAHQRRLARVLQAQGGTDAAPAPVLAPVQLQAAFCIDVRSEPFRRALESCDPAIRTIGFAGFFGLPLTHRGLGACVHEPRLPVLLSPALQSAPDASPAADTDARIAARASRAWGRFKLAAVSSFAFVEAAGPLYLAKLLRDALGAPQRAAPEPAPAIADLDTAGKVAAAEQVLQAMGLTRDFAPQVLLVGHGAQVTNNPHGSALQCGACGGHSGEVSARALAGLLNDPAVRQGLAARAIEIPDGTRFLGALHDTCSDTLTLFDSTPGPDTARLQRWLAQAGRLARAGRAGTLPRASRDGADIPARALDWAETRPEWGLAGCAAFIAAPRARTAGRDLDGRAFLHDYDWRQDDGFGTLTLILTAPVVVASWISLQYYGSTTAPEVFGAGNKLLHNVVGGFGVYEGNGGMLRTGLAWQSVHDGALLRHQPLRLSVIVAAPEPAITDILDRHPQVRALFDNGWLHLLRMDDGGTLTGRYTADGWQQLDPAAPAVRPVPGGAARAAA